MTLVQLHALDARHIDPPKGARLPTETSGSNNLREYMEQHDWFTYKFHGSEFQKGWPDLHVSHMIHGQRLIETKSFRDGHKLEDTQVKIFKQLYRTGVGIWVLRDKHDYHLLFKPPNWTEFL